MRKFNVRLFLVLLLGAAVTTGAVFGAHYVQYPRIARSLLWQARHAEEQGKFERAADYLQRYLEFAPKDLDERVHLARLWAGEHFAGNGKARARALGLLDAVFQQPGGDLPELRRLAAKVALEIGRTKVARDNLEKLLPWEKAPWSTREAPRPDADRGELEALWGQLCEAEARPEDALRMFRQAAHDAPTVAVSYVHRAYLLRRQKEADADQRRANVREADEAMDALVAANPESHEAYLARWNYRREVGLLKVDGALDKGLLKGAAEDVAQAYRRAGDDVDVLLAKASVEQLWVDLVTEQAGDPDDARAAEAKKGELRKHRREARRYLEEGLKLFTEAETPDPGGAPVRKSGQSHRLTADHLYQLQWHLAGLWLDELDAADGGDEQAVGEARKLIAQIRKTRPALRAAADYLDARLAMGLRDWPEAIKLLEQARPALQGMQAQEELIAQINVYLGQCYLKQEQPGQAAEAYARVLQWSPDATAARLGLAEAQWAMGGAEEAMKNVLQAMGQGRVLPGGWLEVARLEVELQLQRDPSERKWQKAEEYVARAAKDVKKWAEVEVLRAEIVLAQGNVEGALELLHKAQTKDPQRPELWIALAALAAHRNFDYQAIKLLEDAEKNLKDEKSAVDLRLARARYLSVRAKPEERRAGLAKLKEGMERFGEDDRARLLGGLAEAWYQAGDVAEARGLLRELAALPQLRTDLRLRLLLYDLALKEGNAAEVDRALEEIKGVEKGEGPYYLFGKALRLVHAARGRKTPEGLDEARDLLDRVDRARPRWSRVYLARAEVEELAGRPEEAIEALKKAVDYGERDPGALQRLVGLLMQAGRPEDARLEVQKLQKWQRNTPGMAHNLAELYRRTGDPLAALDYAARAVPENSKDPKAMVWRAMLEAESPKETDRAEERLKKAIELAPSEPEAWVAYVQFLVGRNHSAEAEALVKEAAARIAPDKAPLALAQCYEALGMAKEAAEKYQEALKGRPDDLAAVHNAARFFLASQNVPEAERLLSLILDGKVPGASTRDLAWATHGLAVIRAAGTDYESFQKALALVGLKLDERGELARTGPGADSVERRLAQARVLATQPQRRFRDKAVELFEEVSRAGKLDRGDQFVLALLYDDSGAWPRARDLFRDLAQAPDRQPSHLNQYARKLIREKELDEAARQVEALEKLEAERRVARNAFGAVEMRARLLEARGRGDEALALLRAHVARKGADPREMLFLIASLGRQGRFADAFALCPEAWQKCPPEDAGGVSVALLHEMKPTDAQCQQVEDWLRAAMGREKDPKTMALWLHLADLNDLRGKYDKAEEVLRTVLQKEPNNVVALNNLAWLLAKRSARERDEKLAADALKMVNAAIVGQGRRPHLLDTRGLVQEALGNTAAAVADLAEAAEDVPTPTRLFHLAQAQAKARERDAALRALRRAKEMGLQVANLHPLEQNDCRRLLDELKAE